MGTVLDWAGTAVWLLEEECHAITKPVTVTINAPSFIPRGRGDSWIGARTAQFKKAPPVIAPVVKTVIGVVRSLLESQVLDRGGLAWGLHRAPVDIRIE